MQTRARNNLPLFLGAVILGGAASGIYESVFNNYLDDAFRLAADARGRLEFWRELPGFLTALFAGALFFVPETRIGVVASLATAMGMFGLAWCGRDWSTALAFIVLWSVGAHLIMPVRSSLGLTLAARGERGRRLGQLSGASTAAAVAGCGMLWLIFHFAPHAYGAAFTLGGVLALGAAVVYSRMRMPDAHLRRPRFVWRRRYWLYYVLAALFGARKQVFITFAPWVLVRVFHQPPQTFAQLGIAGAVLGAVFQPMLGRWIDRFGERRILMVDACCIAAVCLGYGTAHRIADTRVALGLLYACYVLDMLLFGMNMARSTYLSKIAVRPDDVAPTLGMEVSINHTVSMSVPTLGGLAWMKWGHESVFLGAMGVALLMLVFTAMIRLPVASAGEQAYSSAPLRGRTDARAQHEEDGKT